VNQVYQGGQYTVRAVFETSDGALTDPVDPLVSIYDPTGAAFATAQDLIRDAIGQYHFSFVLPSNATLGTWSSSCTGVINGDTVQTVEEFGVLDSGVVTQMASTVTRLRLLLGERIPVGGDETSTRFSDAEITNAYLFNAQDINKTMAELWLAKAGMWAELFDISESGTQRQFSQMQRAAIGQAKVYIDKVSADDVLWTSTYRVVGESFDAFGCLPRPRWMWEPVAVRW